MKTRILFLWIMALCLGTIISCGGVADKKEKAGGTTDGNTGLHYEVEYSYSDKLMDFDDILRFSTNVVRATLETMEDFDGTIQVYHFVVQEDYAGNAPDEINMYDAFDSGYIAGHDYFLFLCKGESALYPHTIYTTTVKDLIIDTAYASATAKLNAKEIELSTDTLAEKIGDAVDRGILGEYTASVIEISESDRLSEVADEADLIVEVEVANEQNANRYVSTYQVKIVSIKKGKEESIPSVLILPPGLSTDTSYCVFLKQTEEGEYVLFSRRFPVVESSLKTDDVSNGF